MRYSINKSFLFLVMCFLSLTCNAQQSNLWNTEHYRDRMAEFAKMRSIDASDIVMLGNSLTEFGGDWSKRLGIKHVRNRGFMGDNVDGVLPNCRTSVCKIPTSHR